MIDGWIDGLIDKRQKGNMGRKIKRKLGRLTYKIFMTQVPSTIGGGGQQTLSILNAKANKKKIKRIKLHEIWTLQAGLLVLYRVGPLEREEMCTDSISNDHSFTY